MIAEVVSAAPGDGIPVIVLTGFLGAGKTTLLSALLRHREFSRTAVIVNEYGEIGLDHDLIRANTDSRIMLLESGCVCCSLRSDLTDTLRSLFRERVLGKIPEFTRVIVETTGLADPGPILNALQADPVTAVRFRLEGVVTVVDAVNADAQMDVHAEAVRQAALADRIILTKTDLASDYAITRILSRLTKINPDVIPIIAQFGDIPPSAFSIDPHPQAPAALSEIAAADHEARHHDHDHGILSFVIEATNPLDGNLLMTGLAQLLARNGGKILRLKGLLDIVGVPHPVVIHGIGHTLYPPESLPAWPDSARHSRIIFITQDLPKNVVENCLRGYLLPPLP